MTTSSTIKLSIIGASIAAALGVAGYTGYKFKSPEVSPTQVMALDEAVVMRTKGGLLEVSTVTATELFEQSVAHSVLGLDLGKTIARIRVPATYRYHVELAPEWRFIRHDKTFIAIAPAVKPSLPVAIDTGKLEGESFGRWSVLAGDKLVTALQKSITSTLAERATSQKYINLQREHARQTLKEFVQKWVLSQDKWKASSDSQIRIFFADEPIEQIQANGFFPTPVGFGQSN